MKFEIGEQLKGTEKKKVNEHYTLFILSNRKGKENERLYICSKSGSHKIWLDPKPYEFYHDENGKIQSDSTPLEFKSIKDVQKWLDNQPVTAKVGWWNDTPKRLHGLNHYQIAGLDIMNILVERRIHIDFNDAIHLVPEEQKEGTGRILKPGGHK